MAVDWGLFTTATATGTLNSVYKTSAPATLVVLNDAMQTAAATAIGAAGLVAMSLY